MFLYLGGPSKRTLQNPNYLGYDMGGYPQVTSHGTTAVEFVLDTADALGRFEIYHKAATGSAYRLLYRAAGTGAGWSMATSGGTALPGDGNLYYELVTLGAAGRYDIRVEYAYGVFFGVRVSPTTSIKAAPKRAKRIIVAGDSFTEPTISDSGASWAWDGYAQQIAYLTGYDVWGAGSGGTGYVKPNTALSRPKLRDRLAADILAFDADEYWIALGTNDTDQSVSAVATEVDLCLKQIKAARPFATIRVIGPWWEKGYTAYPPILLDVRDVVKAACAANGVKFYDPLNYGASNWIGAAGFSTALTAPAAAGANSISVAALPSYFGGVTNAAPSGDWWVEIGGAGAKEVHYINGWMSGAGPYSLPLDRALSGSFVAGTPVVTVGPGYVFGTGRQGTPTGSGDADRITGPDAKHPTVYGHQHIAGVVLSMLAGNI